MPFKLLQSIVDEEAEEDMFGNTKMIAEGRYGSSTYATADDCNAAAAVALYTWLGQNCSEWKVGGVTHGFFDGDESGCAMYTYSESATMKTGQSIGSLIAQFYGGRV
jgi:hypothetical protein